MPKATFFNLPLEKRERITEVIIDEFSENTYETASINQIVKTAEIAKGSFYQYFEDKKDIYKMTIDICQKEKMKYIEKINEKTRYLDDFSIMRELFIAIIKFDLDNPKLSSTLNKFYKIVDLEFKDEILKDIEIDSEYEFKTILQNGIDKGRIYYNVDVELVSFLLENISINVKEYFKIKKDQDKYVSYDGFVNMAIDLIENGIKLKRKRSVEEIL